MKKCIGKHSILFIYAAGKKMISANGVPVDQKLLFSAGQGVFFSPPQLTLNIS